MNASGQDEQEQAPSLPNQRVAEVLEEIADLLEEQGANPFRVRAYREGAKTIRGSERSVEAILDEEDVDGLMQLPGIGQSLAHSIEYLVRHGNLPLLQRLRGEHVPEHMLASVPDIGPKLAQRIHDQLGIETLPELAAAAQDGRLARVPGMGKKRLRAVRESLAGRFRTALPAEGEPPVASGEPDRSVPVEELLDVDEQYRRLARQGHLPRIAPRRFNPTREAWLPILHTERGARHYTALYSNTARAHEAGTTHDWVVIYRDDDERGGPWTVITAGYGPLRGRRIVRGREDECRALYLGAPLPETAETAGKTKEKHQLRLDFGE